MERKKSEKYPCFRFSKLVASMEQLMSWFWDFQIKDIPCCIVRERVFLKQKFSLWRIGEESAGQETKNSKKLVGEIVKKYDPANKFSRAE